MQIEFELGGVQFKGKHLDPEKSLDGFALLSPILGPVLDGIDPSKGDDVHAQLAGVIKGALSGFKDLPKFRPLFLPLYHVGVHDAGTGNTNFLPLAQVANQVFAGKPSLQVAWLLAALHAEYADFLQPAGRATLASLAGRFGFQFTLPGTGLSGGS